jgi:hypothetical protein
LNTLRCLCSAAHGLVTSARLPSHHIPTIMPLS